LLQPRVLLEEAQKRDGNYHVKKKRTPGRGLRRTATVARNNPLLEDSISHLEALALARCGRYADPDIEVVKEARIMSVPYQPL
jgi:hypothetical protein